MVLSELKSLKDSIQELKESVQDMGDKVDDKFEDLRKNVKSLDVSTAVLHTKSSVWGALGGVISTLAIILLSYLQGGKHDTAQSLPTPTEISQTH